MLNIDIEVELLGNAHSRQDIIRAVGVNVDAHLTTQGLAQGFHLEVAFRRHRGFDICFASGKLLLISEQVGFVLGPFVHVILRPHQGGAQLAGIRHAGGRCPVMAAIDTARVLAQGHFHACRFLQDHFFY